MKKTLSITFMVAGALAIGALYIAAIPHSNSQSTSPSQESQHLRVVNPETPAKALLCGQIIDLDRADMWEGMDRELTSMIYTHANTLLTIKRANKYFPVMAPILKKHGVPTDLLYLACVESYLSPRALSPAKAAGMWQIMPITAKEYGLEVSDEVDERYHIEKATAAAAKFLKKAHAKFGDWPSTMASYNGGMGRVSRELEAQMQNTALDLYLTEETQRYPYRVMAMKEIMENPAKYGFDIDPSHLYQPLKYNEVKVDGAVESWPEWAKEHGVSFAQLREANPWIRAKKLTNKLKKTYTVKIPVKDSLWRSKQKVAKFSLAD